MNPLDQLQDIHLPTEVSWWPLAPGYWILLISIIIIISLAVFIEIKRRQKRKYLKQALLEIKHLNPECHSFSTSLQNIIKNTLLFYSKEINDEESTLVNCYDADWQKVLDAGKFAQSSPGKIERLFALHQSLYDPSVDLGDKVALKLIAQEYLTSNYPFKYLTEFTNKRDELSNKGNKQEALSV